MIEVLLISFIAASLTIFLNYCLGKPGSDFSPHEIFSNYTVWLSKRRLKRIGIWGEYLQQMKDSNPKSVREQIEIINDFKRIIYNAAEPFFTWERALGMCSVCTGFWLSLLTGILHKGLSTNWYNIFIYENFLYLVSVIVISHVFIRIINKVI